jgi:hypothetical protein
MSYSNYTQLIEEFCHQNEIDESHRIIQGGALKLNDVVFQLIHCEEANPDLIFIYCDFGAPPQEIREKIYSLLLEANMLIYNGNSPIFSISEHKRVTLIANYPLPECNPEILRHILEKITDKVLDWRETFFLDGQI